jgi:hypothetical protein
LLGPRSWPTSYRGPLAIHAAKAFPGWACELCLTSPFFEALTEGRGAVQALRLPLGKVVAVAELVDVGRISSPEALGYVLGANEVTLATTPGAGTPGSWTTSDRCPSQSRRAARRASGGGMHRLSSRPPEVVSGEHRDPRRGCRPAPGHLCHAAPQRRPGCRVGGDRTRPGHGAHPLLPAGPR